jgi:predicted metal-dependent peptidase
MSATGIDATRLAAARLRAIDAYPFLALALFALTPVPAPGLGTFAVDEKWRLYIDPVTLDQWATPECAGALLHEVSHVVRDHAGRARGIGINATTARRWNLAGDAEINDDLRSDAIALPEHPVFPETLHEPPGMVAEYYYAHLLDVPDARLPRHVDCGSGCHGVDDGTVDLIGELAGFAPGDGSDEPVWLADAPGLDAAEVLLLRRRVAEAVVQWGRQAGTGAGGWMRWANGLLEPVLDWRRLLHGVLRGAVGAVAGASDYTYRRPSRRRLPRVVLPSLERPLPRVAVVIDTSLSMDDRLLDTAWSEVRSCLRSFGVRRDLLTLYAGDVDVERVPNITGRRVALTGGGGTDMATAITTVVHDRRADVIVVLTDGYTPWPLSPPPVRVVVVLLDANDDEHEMNEVTENVPGWARTVVVRAQDAVTAR